MNQDDNSDSNQENNEDQKENETDNDTDHDHQNQWQTAPTTQKEQHLQPSHNLNNAVSSTLRGKRKITKLDFLWRRIFRFKRL